MNCINIIQNEHNNIKKLAAQNLLYTISKNIKLLKFIFTVIFTMILNIFYLIWQDNTTLGFIYVFLCFISVLIQFFPFDLFSTKYQRLAASIQQEFDHGLYPFEKNIVKSITQFEIDSAIRKYSYKFNKKKKNMNVFENWYQNIDANLSNEVAFFTCQKINITWESDLRGKYNILLVSFESIVLLSLFAISMVMNCYFRETIMYVFLPTISLVIYFAISIYRNTKCLSLLKRNYRSISNIEIIIKNDPNNIMNINELINNLQQDIYEYRQIALFIPDFFYNLFRKTEQDMLKDIL